MQNIKDILEKESILNLTQHESTEDQKRDGVVEPEMKDKIKELLTFTHNPTENEMHQRAEELVNIVKNEKGAHDNKVMIGGAPYFMPILENELQKEGIMPIYAFSERKFEIKENGERVTTFQHKGFVEKNEPNQEYEFNRNDRSDYILNITGFMATQEQKQQNVVELKDEDKEIIKNLSEFKDIPSKEDLIDRANSIAEIAKNYDCSKVMMAGAPYFADKLQAALLKSGQEPVYAYSERVSVDKKMEDGSIQKVSEFKHKGFVRPCENLVIQSQNQDQNQEEEQSQGPDR